MVGRIFDSVLQVIGMTAIVLAGLFVWQHTQHGRVGTTVCLPGGYAVTAVAPDTTTAGDSTWRHEGSHARDCAARGFVATVGEWRQTPDSAEARAKAAEGLPFEEEDAVVLGVTNCAQAYAMIRVRTDLTPAKFAEVLVHESRHAKQCRQLGLEGWVAVLGRPKHQIMAEAQAFADGYRSTGSPMPQCAEYVASRLLAGYDATESLPRAWVRAEAARQCGTSP